METLALKLVLTPALIGVATLVGRRWGQAVGGWLVGLPLTSGPVVLFLALERGTGFAAKATQGSLRGLVAEAPSRSPMPRSRAPGVALASSQAASARACRPW